MHDITSHASAGGGCGRSSAINRKISWNICRGMATSAIWKATQRPWLTIFAPILISFSFRLVSDQSLIGSGVASVQELLDKLRVKALSVHAHECIGERRAIAIGHDVKWPESKIAVSQIEQWLIVGRAREI